MVNEDIIKYSTMSPDLGDIEVVSAGYDVKREGSSRNSLGMTNYYGSNPATLDLQTKTSDSGFTFTYNETQTDDGSHVLKSNNYNFTVPVINSTEYERIDMDVDTFTLNNTGTISKSSTGFDALAGGETYAQGMLIDALQYPGTNIVIKYFNITVLAAQSGDTVVGSIWSAALNGSNVVPNKPLQNTTIITPGSGNVLDFPFTSPLNINSSVTYSTGSGGYLFFILYKIAGGTTPLINIDSASSNGETYIYNSDKLPLYNSSLGLPTHPDNWTTQEAFDFPIEYNYTVEFDPLDIGAKIQSPSGSGGIPVASGGLFSETKLQQSGVTYRAEYDPSKIFSYTVYQNISYSTFDQTTTLATVQYSSSAGLAELNWTVSYQNSYNPSNTLVKYLSIPGNFTDVLAFNDGVPLSSPGEYEVVSDGGNNTIVFKVTTGTFTITANSTNLLKIANLTNYVYDGSWLERDNGYMGVIHPSSIVGDQINSTVTNINTLGLFGGTMNSSLYTNTGTIYGNLSTVTYTDTSLSTQKYSFTDNITFSTYLDPDIDTGVYSFQHFWFNGTAGGATYNEFQVSPITNLNLLTPSDVNIIQETSFVVEVEVLDRSHNSSWINADRAISWSFSSNVTDFTNDGIQPNQLYKYSGTIDTSGLVSQAQSYLVNVSFVEGDYMNFTTFNLNIFYKGETSLSGPNSIDESSSFSIKFQLTNATNGNVGLNVSSVIISVNSSYSVLYNPVDENYTITIDWSDSFRFGSNQLSINWTHPDYRTQADQNYTIITFDFTINDPNNPVIVLRPLDSNTLTEDQATTTVYTWNASDTFPGTYQIESNRSGTQEPVDSGSWTSAGTESISLSGLLIGVYNYTITYTDEAGNKIPDTAIVKVVDKRIPDIVQEASGIVYSEGGPGGNNLVWQASDNHPARVYVLKNGSTIFDAAWNLSSEVININVDGLLRNIYNYTVVFNDTSGNALIDTVFVQVKDTTEPAISSPPSDFSYEENSTGNSISWTTTEAYPDYYNIYVDKNLEVNQASWNQSSISYNIDGLSVGGHNITIVLYDESDLSVIDTVIITVVDTVFPKFDSSPEPAIRIFENSTSYELIWVASDSNPSTYTIYKNGTEVASGTWSSSVEIIFDVGILIQGIYNFSIVIEDTSAHQVSDQVILTVKDPDVTETNEPHFVTLIKTYEGTKEEIEIVWNALDNSVITGGKLNLTLFSDGSPGVKLRSVIINGTDIFSVVLDYSGLLPGNYSWVLSFAKEGYETKTVYKSFTILPHNITITITPKGVMTQGQPYEVTIKVEYNNPQSILSLNSILSTRQGGVAGVDLQVTIAIENLDGSPSSLILNVTTTETGIGLLILDATTTSGISKISGISAIPFEDASYIISGPVTLDPKDLPTVEIVDKDLSDLFQEIMDVIYEYRILIAIVAFIILVTIIIFSIQLRRRKERGKRFERLKIKTIEEMEGILNIQAIIMKSTFTGLQFYERVFEDAINVDLSLLSGITTAITSVLSEIKKGELGYETMQRSGLSITMFKGEMVTIVIVSTQLLPEVLKSQLEQIHTTFEDRYERYKEDTQNLNSIPLAEIDDLIQTYMKTVLKENLEIFIPMINRIKERKSVSRKIRSNMNYLIELNSVIDTAGLPLTLHSMYEFLRAKSLSDDQIYQLISTAYAFGIIDKKE